MIFYRKSDCKNFIDWLLNLIDFIVLFLENTIFKKKKTYNILVQGAVHPLA